MSQNWQAGFGRPGKGWHQKAEDQGLLVVPGGLVVVAVNGVAHGVGSRMEIGVGSAKIGKPRLNH